MNGNASLVAVQMVKLHSDNTLISPAHSTDVLFSTKTLPSSHISCENLYFGFYQEEVAPSITTPYKNLCINSLKLAHRKWVGHSLTGN